MTDKWYVIRIKPQSEGIAENALKTNDFDYFYPQVEVPDEKFRMQKAPLFPGYMFLRHDPCDSDWPSLSHVSGVLGWVRVGDEVPSVPDEVVGEISRRIDEINEGGGLWSRFRSGQTVRVVSGDIESLATVVDEPNTPEDRVRVLLDFMGRQVKAEVPWNSLQPTQNDQFENQSDKKPRRTRGRGRWIRGFAPAV